MCPESSPHGAIEADVAIVDRTDPTSGPDPTEHGLDQLRNAIDGVDGRSHIAKHLTEVDQRPCVVIGPIDDPVVGNLLREDNEQTAPESVVLKWCETGEEEGEALVVAGSDDRGVMYALLEVADRVNARGLDALNAIEDTVETPDNEVRGLDRFLANPDEDRWFYDDEFWEYYLARLAKNRFNRFVLITGYDTAFMSPPYPFFLDVPGFEEVAIGDGVDATQQDHLRQLRTIGELCHERGLEFVFGSWQQQPRSANPDLASTDQELLVKNVPDDSERFTDFCARGIEELLVACPEIDAVQLRVNFESGIGDRSTAEEFWQELIRGVTRAGDRRERPVELDPRAKGCTDQMLQWSLEAGLNVTVPTKYWCESTGLPYHNTQMREDELANLDDFNKSRRYGYSDLLQKPHFYDVLYRLWVYGTNRLFLWGDPDYARRFGASVGLGDARGYEVTAPLSMKGGRFFLRDPWPLFEDEELRHYEYEDERYWAWYRLFGRLGYSTDADSDIWEREFERRFGEAAPHVEEAYRAASKVLPLITAAHLTRHPANANWTEMDTGGALFAEHNWNDTFGEVTYMSAEPSDPGLFYGIDEFVTDRDHEDVDRRYTPIQVAGWYEHFAQEVRRALDNADEIVDSDARAEYRTTRVDMLNLADLADYHAQKTRAALYTAIAIEVGETDAFAPAHRQLDGARKAWKDLAERAEQTYGDDILFGRDPDTAGRGTWSDRLEEIDRDLEWLEEKKPADTTEQPTSLDLSRDTLFSPTTLELSVPERVSAGDPIEITLHAGELNGIGQYRLHYRHTDQTEGAFRTVDFEQTGDSDRASIPADYVTAEWDLLAYISALDRNGEPLLFPGLYHATEPEPYYVVRIVEEPTG